MRPKITAITDTDAPANTLEDEESGGGDGVAGVVGVVVGGAGEEPGVPAEDDETVMASFWPI